MPCVEWFESQDQNYRDEVLPPTVRARVFRGGRHRDAVVQVRRRPRRIVSLEHYGESADYKTLFREFGFTPEAVVAAAQRSLTAVKG